MVNRRRRSIGRWLAPVALITCAVAVYAVVDNTLLKDDSASRAATAAPADARRPRRTSKKAAKKRKRRRAYIVKSGDTLSAISIKTGVSLTTHPAAEPQARRRHAPRRPAGQALAVTARDRRAAAALLAAALGLLLALALARPASAPAAPPVDPRARRDPRRAGHRRRRLPAPGAPRARPIASTTKLMTALLTLEHAKLSHVLTTVPYHALAGRVDDRPARRRAHDGRRPPARAAARQRQRRRGDAGRSASAARSSAFVR